MGGAVYQRLSGGCLLAEDEPCAWAEFIRGQGAAVYYELADAAGLTAVSSSSSTGEPGEPGEWW